MRLFGSGPMLSKEAWRGLANTESCWDKRQENVAMMGRQDRAQCSMLEGLRREVDRKDGTVD